LYCESFHDQSISEIFKKVKIFLSKVIDKPKINIYDVYIIKHGKEIEIWQRLSTFWRPGKKWN
jgi:hypothetical protein